MNYGWGVLGWRGIGRELEWWWGIGAKVGLLRIVRVGVRRVVWARILLISWTSSKSNREPSLLSDLDHPATTKQLTLHSFHCLSMMLVFKLTLWTLLFILTWVLWPLIAFITTLLRPLLTAIPVPLFHSYHQLINLLHLIMNTLLDCLALLCEWFDLLLDQRHLFFYLLCFF